MEDRKPSVAVVGCGYWGQNLVRNFHELGSLAAVCDVEASRVRDTAQKYGVLAASSFDDLLEMREIQGIVIATPAAQHFELARRALLAGKDVFVEKPIALHVREGQELVDLSRKHERILMVGHLLLYHPAIRELKRLIRAGDLGRIQYFYSSRLNWGKLRTEENILWSFAPHDISAVLFLLDEEPTEVGAHGASYLNPGIADMTLSTFDFASGVKAHIFVSWMHPFKEQKLVIVGGRKLAVFDDTEKVRKLCLYSHRIDWLDRVPVAQKAEGEVVPLSGDEPLRLECQHFLECVRERRQPLSDGENALRVLRILEACERSLQTSGEAVAINVRPPKYFVHPTAMIDEPCEIGEGTTILHFSHVMEKSAIGKNCNLGQNVHIPSGVRIGNNVNIQNNVSLHTGVELEDDVFCGPSMAFTNVVNPGRYNNRSSESQRTLVKRGASLGANSLVNCGVTIGKYAFVAAGAVVTRDVPEYAFMMGVPAQQAGWMCQCGLRLEISDHAGRCLSCGEIYSFDGDIIQSGPSRLPPHPITLRPAELQERLYWNSLTKSPEA
jgi:UDP-2-acetamido-3-amino-2,3-dideoxy-glucuronate N-acetyltransferase